MAEDIPEAKRYIFIPYARLGEPTDVGDRPLPAGITFHTCSSIHVNGVPYNGTPLVPGPVALSLLVSNRGALDAWVTARFYVSDPLTGFDPAALLDPIDPAEPFHVGANAKEVPSGPQRYDVPDGQPHLCLFAEAWCGGDPSTKPGHVIEDRHWGQQNLAIKVAKPGQRLIIPFSVVGQVEDGRYEVGVRRLGPREGVHSFDLSREAVQLTDLEQGVQSTDPLRIELRPWERRSFEVTVHIPPDAVPGTSAQIVIEQSAIRDERHAPTGAIGVTINVTE